MNRHCENKILLFCAVGTFFIIISILSNLVIDERWINFWGALFGAFASGMITLYVMNKTIADGKENMKQTIAENKKLKKREEDLIFCKDLSELISAFIEKTTKAVEILGYYDETLREIAIIKHRIKILEYQFQISAKAIAAAKTNMGIATHQEKTKYYQYKLDLWNKQLEALRDKLKMPDQAIIIKLYYALKIRLSVSENAHRLYEKMETMIAYWDANQKKCAPKAEDLKKDLDEIVSIAQEILEEIRMQNM